MKNDMREYLKSKDKFEQKYVGIEKEPENSIKEMEWDETIPYNVSDVRIESKMINIFQIERWILEGSLNLRPEYQRNLVWDNKRKSALIESLLLRFPISTFCFDEDMYGKKNIIDGMQRLNSIHEFINDEFELTGLQYFPDCEDKLFSNLNRKYQAYILNTILIVNVLDGRCPQTIKFDIFRRINTTGLQLNSQEIRNMIAKPEVRKLLKNMASCKEFVMATNGRINDIRMGGQELCLRYIMILLHLDWQKKVLVDYHGLEKTMDNTILELNKQSNNMEMYNRILNLFKESMRQAFMILGEFSFRKSEMSNKKINASLFIGWSIVLSIMGLSDKDIESNTDKIFKNYKKQLQDNRYLYKMIRSSSNSKRNIESVLHIIYDIIVGGIYD